MSYDRYGGPRDGYGGSEPKQGYGDRYDRPGSPEPYNNAPPPPPPPPQGGYRDEYPPKEGYRASSRGENRSPPRGGYRSPPRADNRSPPRGGYRSPPRAANRSPPRGGYRSPPRGGYRSPPRDDYRSPPRGGYRSPLRDDYRSPPRGGYRSPPRIEYRSPPRGGYRSPPRDDPPYRKRGREDSRDRPEPKRRRPEGERRLWVGGLPHWYGKEDVLRLFEKYGPIYLCDPRRGFAFLEYEHPEDARRAKEELHGYEPERGRILLVEFRLQGQDKVEHRIPERYVGERTRSPPPRRDYSRSPRRDYSRRDPPPRSPPRSPPRAPRPRGTVKNWRLDIDGLSDRTEWQDLKDWGRDSGLRVEYTAVVGRGRGTIEFNSRDEMEKAESVLRDKPIHGVTVQLKQARIQPDTQR